MTPASQHPGEAMRVKHLAGCSTGRGQDRHVLSQSHRVLTSCHPSRPPQSGQRDSGKEESAVEQPPCPPQSPAAGWWGRKNVPSPSRGNRNGQGTACPQIRGFRQANSVHGSGVGDLYLNTFFMFRLWRLSRAGRPEGSCPDAATEHHKGQRPLSCLIAKKDQIFHGNILQKKPFLGPFPSRTCLQPRLLWGTANHQPCAGSLALVLTMPPSYRVLH